MKCSTCAITGEGICLHTNAGDSQIYTEFKWDVDKMINTDHLTDDQWDLVADIFKDFK